jgi:hypothetical protein
MSASVASARMLAAEVEVGAEAVVAQRGRHPGQRVHVDDARAQLGELSLREVGVIPVQPLGDDDRQHRVAEELQPLVGGQPTVLVGVGPVGQRKRQQVVGDLDAEGRQKRPVVIHGPLRTAFRHTVRDQAGVTTWRPS